MRDASEIQIESLIVHILDPQGRGYVESQAALPLDGDELIHDYFASHIQSSLQISAAKAARFRKFQPQTPAGFCRDLLSGHESLVIGSQGLARPLYQILANDNRTKSADLAVCFYRAGNYPGERFLAILKLDPSEVFRHVIATDRTGRRYVTYQAEPEGFTREKLQKCAFIRQLDPRYPDYDMILLDTQVRDRRRRDVAKYFQEDYLDVEDALDTYKRTDHLYLGMVDGLNRVSLLLSARQILNLENQIEVAITGGEINLDTWVAQLPIPPEAQAAMDRAIRQRLPDRQFELDQTYGQRLVRKRYFQGDFGLKLQVDRDAFSRIVRTVEALPDGQGGMRAHRVVLEVPNWREVTPP